MVFLVQLENSVVKLKWMRNALICSFTGMIANGAIVASIFMMATSAMGPGFLTQTAVFTVKLGAAFGFAILISILIDYVVQQNIWRVVTLTQMRASDIANKALPGSGYLLAFLVILGGFFFSVGNIAGAALGLNALLASTQSGAVF